MVDTVTIEGGVLDTVVIETCDSVIEISTTEGDTVVISEAGSQGPVGDQGSLDTDSLEAIKSVVAEVIHSDSTNDGISVDATGNIGLSIGTLQSMP